MPSYDIIIGLEVHVQLDTKSKLFCGCSTKFGAAPNTQICQICIGMPGVLPVMNRRAFELSLRTAVAINCQIARYTKWDRKQYYYPDLPKGYQISQYDLPFSHDGWLEISDPKGKIAPKRIGIIRAHLEEDAGKSMHDERAGVADSQIDLNRTGTPLLEIVSQPDLRSPAEAKAFLSELKLLLTYLGVSDCNMQEGSLRVDGNVNLHIDTPEGQVATPIVEIKNMNSFRAVERALAYEAERQYEVWQETGQKLGDVPKQTRGWDDAANVTRGQRHKEESSDYRYFPDPDLVPVTVTEAEVERIQTEIQSMLLPSRERARLEQQHGLSAYDADVLVSLGPDGLKYFGELATASGDYKLASNWMQQDVLRTINDQGWTINSFPIPSGDLGGMLSKVASGQLSTHVARDVFKQVINTQTTISSVLSGISIVQVDDSELVALCRELLAANPKVAEDFKAGKMQAIGALVGQAKKKNPNVNPGRVREVLIEELGKL